MSKLSPTSPQDVRSLKREMTVEGFFDELAEHYAEATARPPNSVTSSEFAKRISAGLNVAKRILDAEYEAGRLERKEIMINGHNTYVYWPKAG